MSAAPQSANWKPCGWPRPQVPNRPSPMCDPIDTHGGVVATGQPSPPGPRRQPVPQQEPALVTTHGDLGTRRSCPARDRPTGAFRSVDYRLPGIGGGASQVGRYVTRHRSHVPSRRFDGPAAATGRPPGGRRCSAPEPGHLTEATEPCSAAAWSHGLIKEQEHGQHADHRARLRRACHPPPQRLLRRRLLPAGHCARFGRHGTSRRFGWQPRRRDRTGNRSWTNESSPVLTA